ncbi:B3 domain-containing protein REM10-like isoform X2 [Tasmannia lanceolata]|uniref:B3 domain-containing protein REM10-like isoform X2 n=1 Tax=Tasmannia lanceolata TaxID=3420 RepID=UPI004063F528
MNDKKMSSDREIMKRERYSHQPKFLMPIFPEFFQRISIPIAFNRYLVGEKSDIAILKSPLGKSWRVKVRGRINGVFFEDGWEDFVADHGLSSGEILVFRFEGNMVFHVTIFDETACEKNYHPHLEHVEASKGQKGGLEGSTSYKPKAPHFLATIKQCNLNRAYMSIPKEFVVANNLGNIIKITLKDPEGRSLPVTISQRKSPHNATFFSAGWLHFAFSNKLEEGDECIFELMAEDVMKVQICRR